MYVTLQHGCIMENLSTILNSFMWSIYTTKDPWKYIKYMNYTETKSHVQVEKTQHPTNKIWPPLGFPWVSTSPLHEDADDDATMRPMMQGCSVLFVVKV
jgi:hypothetical protein